MSAEYVRSLCTADLCDWLRNNSGIAAHKLEAALKVIVEQDIDGGNFLDIANIEIWRSIGLNLGAAMSLFQIAQKLLAAAEDVERPSKKIDSKKLSEENLVFWNFGLDGIFGQKRYLGRERLVKDALNKLNDDRYLLISSPPATGKTSLLQILCQTSLFKYEYIGCTKDVDPYEVLKNHGINLKPESSKPSLERLVVILDDAQNFYRCPNFWTSLFKHSSTRYPNLKFIFAVTHNRDESPIEFQSLSSRIDRSLLLLTDDETNELFDLLDVGKTFKLKDYPTVLQVISNETAGVVGAIVLSVRKILSTFRYYTEPEESAILQYFYSKDFSSEVGRLFGVADIELTLQPELRKYLSEIFFAPAQKPALENSANIQILNKLVKGGALVYLGNLYSFSSALAKRFYIQKIFPTRATQVPSDLRCLVILAIQNMSSAALKMSTVSLSDFPKEAVFQHQFMAGLLASLPEDCYVCPELSKDFPEEKSAGSQKIDGEIDFYVNGNLRWGIELLVNGNQVREHMSRFAESDGKYAKLGSKDYIVVDFRSSKDGKPTNVTQTDKRMCVCFQEGDFSKCVYRFGLESESFTINLNS